MAGAAAADGKPLYEVLKEAQAVATSVGTMGVALTVCTLPGATPSDRLGPGKMELGLGIVSEPFYLQLLYRFPSPYIVCP